jgi:hypothetical protein
MVRATTALLLAFVCIGCTELAVTTSMTRYNVGPHDKPGVDGRFQAYLDCTQKDNTSWDILDACMVAKGYTVKK